MVDLSWICGESVVGLSQMPAAFSSLKNSIHENHENLTEMGPYGSVGAHIKTGRSPMAHDHFQTPPDPKKGCTNSKSTKKLVFFSKGGHHQVKGIWMKVYMGKKTDRTREILVAEAHLAA